MAEIAKPSHELRLMAAMIPAKISKAETLDRLNFASQMVRKAAEASDRVLADGYRQIAKAALAAEPRAEVAARAAQLRAKANAMSPGEPRDALLRQAQALLDANPAAPTAEERARASGPVNAGGTIGMGEPRVTGPGAALPADGPQKALPGDAPGRQVVKAALVGVYNERRRLVGVVDRAAIRQRVVKAAKGKTEPQMQAVFDADGNLVGIVDPADITPVSGSGTSTAAASPAEPMPADADADAAGDVAKMMMLKDGRRVPRVPQSWREARSTRR